MGISTTNRDRIFVGVVFLAAVGLRFSGLGTNSLWLDEAFTWGRTQQTWSELFTNLPSSGNLPLFYIFNKLITDAFGMSTFNLRVFSALVSVVSLSLAQLLGRRVGGRPGMHVAVLFWAFHPMLVWYGVEAKPYSLTVFLALSLLLVFLRLHQGAAPRLFWMGAAALLALGQLSHYYFFIFGGALTLFAVAKLRPDPYFFRRWILVWAIGSLPLLGWLLWYFSQPSPTLGAGWIAQPRLTAPLGTLWNLLSGYGGFQAWPAALFGIATAILVTTSLVYKSDQENITRSLVFGLLAPISGMWLISQLRPLYMDRYFIVLLPFVLLLLSAGSAALWERIKASKLSTQLNWTGLIVFMMVSFWAAWQVHAAPQYAREDWVGLTAYLTSQRTTDDELWLSNSSVALPLAFYGLHDYPEIVSEMPPRCGQDCWWVLRQPYTATHAFSQTVSLPDQPWIPELPTNCQQVDSWYSSTGVALLLVTCPD